MYFINSSTAKHKSTNGRQRQIQICNTICLQSHLHKEPLVVVLTFCFHSFCSFVKSVPTKSMCLQVSCLDKLTPARLPTRRRSTTKPAPNGSTLRRNWMNRLFKVRKYAHLHVYSHPKHVTISSTTAVEGT